jgi:short-subunit dehydrogenase
VHPGGVQTAFARNAAFADGLDKAGLTNQFEEQQAKTTPQRAAQIILEAVGKNKARVLIGSEVKAMDLLVRLTGSGHDRLLAGPVMNRVKHAVHRLLIKG